MKLTDDMKAAIKNAPYLSFITLGADGHPHPIIVGGKNYDGDAITISIYKMEVTQKNLTANNKAWAMVAFMDGEKPKGYRFAGTAKVQDKNVVLIPESAEPLI